MSSVMNHTGDTCSGGQWLWHTPMLVGVPAALHPTVATLVCAGNRRKEENLTKQTIGFNWGAAGHACSVWKGVL